MPDERGRLTMGEFEDEIRMHAAGAASRGHLDRRAQDERDEHDETSRTFDTASPEDREDLILVARTRFEEELRRLAPLRTKPGPLGLDPKWLDRKWKSLIWREVLAEWRRSSSYGPALLRARSSA